MRRRFAVALYRACDSQPELMQQGHCAGFLDALTTRLNMTGAICSPQGSILGEAILSFQK